ncbi:hypothetical protein N8612_01860 [Verrucomicrobia bacterium]|nr:hypothetical protein [Verrucomicrobiota bacterium]
MFLKWLWTSYRRARTDFNRFQHTHIHEGVISVVVPVIPRAGNSVSTIVLGEIE